MFVRARLADFPCSLSLALALSTHIWRSFLRAIFPSSTLLCSAHETVSMTTANFCRPVRDAWIGANERCFLRFPCLADPGTCISFFFFPPFPILGSWASLFSSVFSSHLTVWSLAPSVSVRRSSWVLKFAMVALHLIYVGCLFLWDTDLRRKTKEEPWYIGIYLALFVAALFQYFLTSSSSPGYVLDAMREGNGTHATFSKTSMTSKQAALSKNERFKSPADVYEYSREIPGVNTSSWIKRVMDLYPLGSSSRYWTCTYCNVVQPPRAKHCHDCDKCVLQFDHHCVWLGTCIGQGNHCRFWWFIFEETILYLWTGVFYISFLKADFARQWWKDAIAILLLVVLCTALIFLLLLLLFHSYLVLTNQTTYELVRRRRISYLRGIPERIHPFSKGMCRNLYNFCCARGSIYDVEPLPTAEELEAMGRPYTCMDILSCRCC